MISKYSFSIVTPSFNQAEFLEETLQSIFSQKYQKLQYIVIDGGSTDGSVDIIKKYESQLSYWCSEPDRGQCHAINKGFTRATGDIFFWLNSDDTLEPNALHTVAQYFVEHPDWQALTGGCYCIDEKGRYLKMPERKILDGIRPPESVWACPHERGSMAFKVWFRDWFPQSSTFWRRELWEQSGPLDERLYYSMDYELWRRMAAISEINVVPEVLSTYLFHSDAKCAKNTWGPLQEVLSINVKQMGEKDFKDFSEEAMSFLIDQLNARENYNSVLNGQIERILTSPSFKLGNILLRPLSAIRRIWTNS